MPSMNRRLLPEARLQVLRERRRAQHRLTDIGRIAKSVEEANAPPLRASLAQAFLDILQPYRIKCFYGGRGGGKSISFARALTMKAHTEKHLILCTRQFQSTIADSVYRVLVNQISSMGLADWFDVQKTRIISHVTGTQFIFKGIYHHPEEIKSLEGVTICWVEEAQAMTEDSWLILEPTIRANGSEIWVSFNPDDAAAPTYMRMLQWSKDALDPQALEKVLVRKVGWQDNPWFPETMERQRLRMLRNDPEAYDWIWEGQTRRISDAAIFRGRYRIMPFTTPETVDRFFYGADWGFADDPSVLIRCFIKDECLWIDHEAYGVGVELEDIPALFAGGPAPISGNLYAGVPGARDWPIKADSSRPETISYVARNGGMNIMPARKWQGSVEDGIMHLKSFRMIYIHERCVNMATEARLYSFKVDPRQKGPDQKPLVLPIVVDAHNHGFDSVRYALDDYIAARGGLAIWERLAS